MSTVKIFIDASVYIAWLRKESEYNNIEKIIEFIKNKQIEVVTSLDVMLEIIKGGNGYKDWERVDKNFSPIKHYLTPNFIIGDTNGSYKAFLDASIQEWESLSSLTNDNSDTKHFITGKNLGTVEYFLALDDKFFNKMRSQGKDFLADTQLVRPSDFIQVFKRRGK